MAISSFTPPPIMYALEIKGDRLVPVMLPPPQPGPGELLIKTAYAGVNRADVFQLQGAYPLPETVHKVPGLEVSGEVVAHGPDVPEAAPATGDPVMALLKWGGYAEYVVCPAVQCLPVPDGLSLPEAAALPEALFTSWMALVDKGQLQEGEHVFLHGGASGIGTIAIQMAMLLGAKVCAAASTPEKAALCRELGADLTVELADADYMDQVKAWSGGGVDVIMDMAAGKRVPEHLQLCKPGGRIVTIACLEGAGVPAMKAGSLLVRQLSWMGVLLRPQPVEVKACIAASLRTHMLPHIVSGTLKPVIDSVFPMEKAADALKKMQEYGHRGKILLEVAAKNR